MGYQVRTAIEWDGTKKTFKKIRKFTKEEAKIDGDIIWLPKKRIARIYDIIYYDPNEKDFKVLSGKEFNNRYIYSVFISWRHYKIQQALLK